MEEKKAIKAKEAQASWHKRLFHLFGALLYLGVLIACAWNIIVVLIALIGALVDAMRRGYPRCIGWLMEIILGKERPPKQAKR